jgi:lipoprotein-anchoring transpeptidase ErfK/SrfK
MGRVYLPGVCIPAALSLFLGACAGDRTHVVRVSVPEQRMTVFRHGHPVASYPVSTSKFGLGDVPGSNCTPLGKMAVAQKIGGGAPLGMKFKDRRPTGEIVPVNAPGRDPIVTRILWLRGLEKGNANAFERMIYIHGTPEEARLGTPASYGCIRMRSRDVAELFDTVGKGAQVLVSNSSTQHASSTKDTAAQPTAQAAVAAQTRAD